MNLGIFNKMSSQEKELKAYTDNDYAGDTEDKKSTSRYTFLLRSGYVTWSSKKQHIVTLSTIEAEFVTATVCACQVVWMRRILMVCGHEERDCTSINCDNSFTIKLFKNPVMHGRSKHINVGFHFLKNLSEEGVISLVYCVSVDQIADIMTKSLKTDVFQKLRISLSMKKFVSLCYPNIEGQIF